MFFFLFSATMAGAQTKQPVRGPFVSLSWGGVYHHLKGTGSLAGGGENVSVGWSFPNGFSVFLYSDGALLSRKSIGDSLPNVHPLWSFNGAGVRYNAAKISEKNDLYVQASYQSAVITTNSEEKHIFRGRGFAVGGGVMHQLARQWVLQGTLTYSYSRFHTMRVHGVSTDLYTSGSSVKLAVGFGWHPFSR